MSRTIPVQAGAQHAEWVPVLERHATIQDLWDWMRAQDPPKDVCDVVVQDEYTHDVVVEIAPRLFAVYDST